MRKYQWNSYKYWYLIVMRLSYILKLLMWLVLYVERKQIDILVYIYCLIVLTLANYTLKTRNAKDVRRRTGCWFNNVGKCSLHTLIAALMFSIPFRCLCANDQTNNVYLISSTHGHSCHHPRVHLVICQNFKTENIKSNPFEYDRLCDSVHKRHFISRLLIIFWVFFFSFSNWFSLLFFFRLCCNCNHKNLLNLSYRLYR